MSNFDVSKHVYNFSFFLQLISIYHHLECHIHDAYQVPMYKPLVLSKFIFDTEAFS
jgi:hypothetical protein